MAAGVTVFLQAENGEPIAITPLPDLQLGRIADRARGSRGAVPILTNRTSGALRWSEPTRMAP